MHHKIQGIVTASMNNTGNKVTFQGVCSICEALKTNSTLKALNLWGMTNQKMPAVTKWSHFNGKDEAGNEVADQGAQKLSEVYQVNTTLVSLNLWGEQQQRQSTRVPRH